MKKKSKKLVRVFWRDICGISSSDNEASWFTKKQLIKKAQELFEEKYITVGYIVAETKDWIAIAATWDESDETLYSDASMIMKSVIIKTEVL